jgi:saccharopine dehydrogenase-like NADP-dependent oxidoreductase
MLSEQLQLSSLRALPSLYTALYIVCIFVLTPIMSEYKSFAVAGAGLIGAPIAKELVRSGAKTRVLTRAGSSKSFEKGVEVREVNYEDEVRTYCAQAQPASSWLRDVDSSLSQASLVDGLKGIDVVVSTLSGAGFAVQPALAKAASKAGVKLFVPSCAFSISCLLEDSTC